MPPGLHQNIRTAEGTTGVLDASVVAVGILGAYAAILAVYLLIAGFSAKWGTQSVAAAQPQPTHQRLPHRQLKPDETNQTKGGTAA